VPGRGRSASLGWQTWRRPRLRASAMLGLLAQGAGTAGRLAPFRPLGTERPFPTSQNHGMLWVGRTFRGHPAQPPAASRAIFNQTRLLRAPSSLALDVSRHGALTTSLRRELIRRVPILTAVSTEVSGSGHFPELQPLNFWPACISHTTCQLCLRLLRSTSTRQDDPTSLSRGRHQASSAVLTTELSAPKAVQAVPSIHFYIRFNLCFPFPFHSVRNLSTPKC